MRFYKHIVFVMDKYFDFSIKGGSSMLVCGPTMAGKSTFVHNLLKDKSILINNPLQSIGTMAGKAPIV